MEMVDKAVMESERMICDDWIKTTLLDKCWSTLEYGRVMREILEGGEDLRKETETGLRDIREREEAEFALLSQFHKNGHLAIQSKLAFFG